MNLISSNQGEIDINKFEIIKRINNGGFGIIYEVKEKETGKVFAAKSIDCEDDEKMHDQIKREVTIMMYAQHPTIISFRGYSKVDFDKENNITIIMELAKNGSLKNVIKKIQKGHNLENYTNTSRQIILVGVARGMKYLHDRNIIHRDLKTDNVVLDENFHPYITDFGLSKFYETGHSLIQSQFGGTLQYEAPEILQELPYDQKADVYSFGILMFEVLTNSSPYPELEKKCNIGNITQFMSKVIQQNYRPKFTVPIKKSIRNLIEKCWSKDPKERPSFGEIFTKLSNQNDDFILDDVDVDELNLYIEKITQITDGTEKLLSTISKLETENAQLKEEIDNLKCEIKHQKVTVGNFSNDKLQLENEQLKIEIKKLRNQIEENESKNNKRKVQNKYVKCVIVGGNDEFNQLGEKQNNKNKFGDPIINPPAQLSINISSILSYSCYNNHTVVVMNDGSLKGIGNNMNGQISGTLPKTIIEDFTDFSIKDDNGSNLSAISAVCSFYSTLYMFSKSDDNGRQLVLCDEEINNGEPVFLNIKNHHPLSLFGGWMYFAVICSEGEIIFINRYSIKNSPNSKMEAVSLPGHESASSVACCDDIIFVLSTEGKVFSSPINKETKILKFSPVLELSDQKIICISGTFNHCLAVSQKGNVFGYGSNEYGQLGLCEKTKSLSSFTKISSLDICEINSAYAGYDHSLFKTGEGKILSCGYNSCGELLFDSGPSQNVYSPTETMITNGATFCIGGYGISVVFIGENPPPNTPNIPIQEY